MLVALKQKPGLNASFMRRGLLYFPCLIRPAPNTVSGRKTAWGALADAVKSSLADARKVMLSLNLCSIGPSGSFSASRGVEILDDEEP